jgi:hypothetical protein
MIETEKATDRLDLPHAYDEVNVNGKTCVCGRQRAAEVHNARPITEQASHSAPLQTEKGS